MTLPSPTDAVSYWLAASPAGPEHPPLSGDGATDVVVVGAGFTGLWTAIALTDTDPSLRVAVLEAETVGFGASGRNGGFCQASLTHGLANGIRHFPDELGDPRRGGPREPRRDSIAFIRDNGIDCDLERDRRPERRRPAVPGRRVPGVGRRGGRVGRGARVPRPGRRPRGGPLAALAGRASTGRRRRVATSLVDPAKLVRGLARVAAERGVAIHERTRVESVERRAGGVIVRTASGASLRADHVVVATSAYSGWLRRLSSQFVPVYDYAIVSEPLTPDQRAAIGWRRRQGMSDANNQFHYFRLTADDRILWGGYDAIYYTGNGVGPEFDRRPATTDKLERAVPGARSRSWGRSRSRTAGAARSTRRRGSRSRSGRRSAAG